MPGQGVFALVLATGCRQYRKRACRSGWWGTDWRHPRGRSCRAATCRTSLVAEPLHGHVAAKRLVPWSIGLGGIFSGLTELLDGAFIIFLVYEAAAKACALAIYGASADHGRIGFMRPTNKLLFLGGLKGKFWLADAQ